MCMCFEYDPTHTVGRNDINKHSNISYSNTGISLFCLGFPVIPLSNRLWLSKSSKVRYKPIQSLQFGMF